MRREPMFAVLAWRGDAQYDASDVLLWATTRTRAEAWALSNNGGRGLVVRRRDYVRNAGEYIPTVSEARAKARCVKLHGHSAPGATLFDTCSWCR